MEKKVKSWPTISIITATYNSARTLDNCLRLVRTQNYPQNKIEIVIGDGGSTDATLAIAKKHQAKVILIDPAVQNAEYNRGVAYNQAEGEFALILDHDNYLPHNNSLRDLVTPLVENPEMVASEDAYYHYDPNSDIIERYAALFGTNEPLVYYLGKADRLPWLAKKWILLGKAQEKNNYFIVRFENNPRRVPSVGTNGCLVRRKLVNKYADVSPEHHYPIDVMVDVIAAGYNEFGFVKDSIIHSQQSNGLVNYLKRRWKFVEQYHFQDLAKRRWSVVMPGDGLKVAVFVLISLTFVIPIWEALTGFVKIRDRAWFVHPVMCVVTTLIYGVITIKYLFVAKTKS